MGCPTICVDVFSCGVYGSCSSLSISSQSRTGTNTCYHLIQVMVPLNSGHCTCNVRSSWECVPPPILLTRTRSRPSIGVDEPGTRDTASTRVPGYYGLNARRCRDTRGVGAGLQEELRTCFVLDPPDQSQVFARSASYGEVSFDGQPSQLIMFGSLWAILSGVESTLSTAHSVPRRPFALQEPRDTVLI